ncbi:hypothetical protein V2J09_023131 [Rumex salicifolius]
MESTVQEKEPRCRMEFEEDEDPSDSCVDDETMEPLHSKIPKENIPRVGLEFETEDEAYEFYNAYALMVGFSVRKSSAHRYRGTVLDRILVCSCQGKRGPDKRDSIYKSHRPETRCGCLARLKISCRHVGKYRVTDFVAKHNHGMASPAKIHLFRSHRRMSTSQASEVDMDDVPGIATRNAYVYMASQAGGCLGSSGVDVRNYLPGKRSVEMKSGDTRVVLAYLQSMMAEDPSFFYAIQVDEDDLITNIFWADSRMMTDYEDFGDVVCFDTTYLKQKDGRPLALFLGVNNHKQSTIFGVALLYDETSESFVWLFDTFSKAMGGKKPKTVLTDEHSAMSKALAFQWPTTYHCLCIWQIFRNTTIQLSDVFTSYDDFSSDFSNCIYEYEREEEFLNAWTEMLGKYELQNNAWLKRMFDIKEKWALVYGRDRFIADITTTQRGETMDELIEHYVSYEHDLRIFFENFQLLLLDRRYDEFVADFKGKGEVPLPLPIAILQHAASVYTIEVFQLFKDELCKAYDSPIEVCGEMEALVKYKVTPYKKHYSYMVSYDVKQETVCCDCRKFEFSGLLCSHILKVFSYRGIKEVPIRYILKRWTRNAKRGSTKGTSDSLNVDEDPKSAVGRRYRDLCRLSTRLIIRAAEVEDGYTLVKEGLLNLFRELDLASTERPTKKAKRPKHTSSHPVQPSLKFLSFSNCWSIVEIVNRTLIPVGGRAVS